MKNSFFGGGGGGGGGGGADFLFNDQTYAKLQLQYNEYTCSVHK